MFAIVDCNNFYVSCERVFNPKLANRPVIVLSNNDGCVISRSNEAKALGIKMAQPAFLMTDFLRTHNVAQCSSNYALYGDMSERVMNTLATLVKDIEIYSIDEAFLDLSGYPGEDMFTFAGKIKNTVQKWTGIPVSVGVAPTKTLAKIANHQAKKNPALNGICFLDTQEKIRNLLSIIKVDEVWGIAQQRTKFLNQLGIVTANQLMAASDNLIKKHLTVMGLRTVFELRGISCIPMEKHPPMRKAICTARSFGANTSDYKVISEAVANYAARCGDKLRKRKLQASILMVFVETNQFKENLPQYNCAKAINLPAPSNLNNELIHFALQALKMIFKPEFLYKKAGVVVEGLSPATNIETNLFENTDRQRNQKLIQALDALNLVYGRDCVRIAAQGYEKKWKLRQELLSPNYTGKWEDILEINLDI